MSAYSSDQRDPKRFHEIRRGVFALVPPPLPRRLPLDESLTLALDEASRAVAELAGVARSLPNPALLTAPFLRREAVLSSRIEGTQASLSDVYAFEVGGAAHADSHEVANYVRALERGRALLAELPICGRLINEMHAVLLDGVRGGDQRPGEQRDIQVWIGVEGTPIEDATYVPPPHERIPELLADWERFLHEETLLPPLVRCALMHYQFEAIHPFRDGNGRIGRLLISLFLIETGLLPLPLLYLSAYFERERERYYAHLQRVSTDGDWHGWLAFFLAGVKQEGADAIRRVDAVHALRETYRSALQQSRASGNTLQLVDHLFVQPVVTVASAAAVLGVTSAGARNILVRLVGDGVLTEVDTYPRLYVATGILATLE